MAITRHPETALGIERRRNHFVPDLPLPLQVDLLSLNQEATLMARAPPPDTQVRQAGDGTRFLRGARATRPRRADEADPFIRKRLLDLADKYDAKVIRRFNDVLGIARRI